MTQSKSDGINQEDASLLLGLSTTKSTAPVTSAGRYLDALVAVEVMGWKPETPCLDQYGDTPTIERDTGWWCTRCGLSGQWGDDGFDSHFEIPRRYSTSIADAWLVVEKLELSVIRSEDGWCAISPYDVEHGHRGLTPESDNPRVFREVRSDARPLIVLVGHPAQSFTYADTAPLAICLTALKAVGA